LNVNSWHIIADRGSAIFEVINNMGEKINDTVKKGNYLRITIPLIPGPPAGKVADWVKVEKIMEKEIETYQYIAIPIRFSPAPISSEPRGGSFFCSGSYEYVQHRTE